MYSFDAMETRPGGLDDEGSPIPAPPDFSPTLILNEQAPLLPPAVVEPPPRPRQTFSQRLLAFLTSHCK